jgi:hypothetical protein
MWHRPQHSLGYIPNKASAFGLSPISIVVENSSDYVSEKVVDALVHGVAPIYIGPQLSSFGIPDDVAIQVDPDPKSVVSALAHMSPEKLQVVLKAGASWINSPAARVHSFNYVMSDLATLIADRMHATSGSIQDGDE